MSGPMSVRERWSYALHATGSWLHDRRWWTAHVPTAAIGRDDTLAKGPRLSTRLRWAPWVFRNALAAIGEENQRRAGQA